MEVTIKTTNSMELYGNIDIAAGDQKGVIILIHGLGEHSGRYDNWIAKFVESGFNIIRVDLPGHGKSGGKRGHIQSFETFREIIRSTVRRANEEFPEQSVILYGHSLGGTIVLDYLVSGAEGINLSIVTSPWLKLSFEPPKSKMVLAAIVKSIIPGLQQPTGLIARHISHDNEVVQKYVDDPLIHNKISVALFSGTFSAARNILKGVAEIPLPLLLIHGTDDRITSPAGSSDLAARSGKTTLRLWEGGYHELHNEPFRDELFSEMNRWLSNMLAE